MATYIAKNTLKNNKTKKRFEIGDVVTEKDFPKSVIKHWLSTGELVAETKKTSKEK